MYEKPQLERFGTLRDLTLIGLGANGLGLFFDFDGVCPNPYQPGASCRS